MRARWCAHEIRGVSSALPLACMGVVLVGVILKCLEYKKVVDWLDYELGAHNLIAATGCAQEYIMTMRDSSSYIHVMSHCYSMSCQHIGLSLCQ